MITSSFFRMFTIQESSRYRGSLENDIMKISGVYKITNIITGDFYIGSSKNIMLRLACHKCPSKWKQSPGSKLYQAFIKFGLNNFTFNIIEETFNLKEREQYWIDQLHPSYNRIRANGQDTERYKETNKEYYKAHQAEKKSYQNRLCFYEGETITLQALSNRFYRQGIPYPVQEAKKYLLQNI